MALAALPPPVTVTSATADGAGAMLAQPTVSVTATGPAGAAIAPPGGGRRATAPTPADANQRPAGAATGPGATARPVVSPHEQSTVVRTVGPADNESGEPEDEAAVATAPTLEDAPSAEFDEAAEAAFLSEARERGEVVAPKPATEVEEANPKALPPLDELVNKIPPEVRDVLEDLFRARFVTVKRFPKKALKG